MLVAGAAGFSRHETSSAILVFGAAPEAADETPSAGAPVGTPADPPAIIQAAIATVAREYATHPVLEEIGLGAREWTALFQSNIAVESAYNPEAVSPVGAIGLGQLMPETAADLGVDPTSMLENLDGSARYLLQMMAEFGSVELALAAYNAGPGAVAEHGGVPPYPETQNHVRRVLATYEQLGSL